MLIEKQTIKPQDFPHLIEFDRIHLIEVMGELGIRESRCPPVCQLAVIPQNGRVITAHMRHGYKIIKTVSAYIGLEYPDTFRCIMEKNLAETSSGEQVLERYAVSVLDEQRLTQLTNDGFMGTSFIRESNQIVFERVFSS